MTIIDDTAFWAGAFFARGSISDGLIKLSSKYPSFLEGFIKHFDINPRILNGSTKTFYIRFKKAPLVKLFKSFGFTENDKRDSEPCSELCQNLSFWRGFFVARHRLATGKSSAKGKRSKFLSIICDQPKTMTKFFIFCSENDLPVRFCSTKMFFYNHEMEKLLDFFLPELSSFDFATPGLKLLEEKKQQRRKNEK